MEVIAVQKYVRVSPKKLRAVASLTKSMKPKEAVEVLPFSRKGSASYLVKVVKSALANAKNKGVSPEDLIFKEIQINEGPRLKRGRPVSRGRWHAYQKRMSHIRVVLATKAPKNLGTEEPKKLKIDKPKKNLERKSAESVNKSAKNK